MGVLGLTPFLLRTCPEVIKRLPERFKAFSGKTLVLDGTLITQRLHYAPFPHAYRHVLGWYRLIKELHESEVRAICVFDGKDRSVAKAREVERRRQARKVDIIRGSIESSRFHRLQKLSALLANFRFLRNPEKDKAVMRLRSAVLHPELSPTHAVSDDEDALHDDFSPSDDADVSESQIHEILRDRLQWIASHSQNISVNSTLSPSTRCTLDVQTINGPIPAPRNGATENSFLPSNENVLTSLTEYYHDRAPFGLAEPFELPRGADKTLINKGNIGFLSADFINEYGEQLSDEDATNFPSPPATEIISAELTSLYLDFCRSVPKFVSALEPSESVTSTLGKETTRSDLAMSKTQYQLILDEGKFWEHLAESPSPEQNVIDLESLLEKSNMIYDSYKRRAKPPTYQTYEECKDILRAMGVPCVESVGPFEAEALASSLVIHGYADYVATEDTDVLIYEAPMIRNITNRKGPLILVSGSDVRAGLQLNRASFLDFALLLGTDFSERIKNVGPQRALKFIRQHGSIEHVIENETQYPPKISTSQYLQQVQIARLIFETLPPIPDPELLKPMESNSSEVVSILNHFGLYRAAMYDWNYDSALNGNYFQDNPSAY